MRARGLPPRELTPDSPVGQHPTILSWHRVLACLAAGCVAGVAVAASGLPEAAVLTGWIVAGGGLLAWTWRIGWPRDAEQTRELAEDEGRTRATDTAVLGAAVISLVAVVEALVRSGSTDAAGVSPSSWGWSWCSSPGRW